MSDNADIPVLRQYQSSDRSAVLTLLAHADLPVDDLSDSLLNDFVVAAAGRKIVGLIGLQSFATAGLLRSLVVASPLRRTGLGSRLVGELEKSAQASGFRELWLLTIDADQFFIRHGFAICSRDCAPASIRATEEFSVLCPGDAHLMRKTLP